MEDFQNKVNTLKARYGLILKKNPEAQEMTKPTQTTLIYKSTQNASLLEKRELSREPEKKIKVETEGKESSVLGGLGLTRFGARNPTPEAGTGTLQQSGVRQGSTEPISRGQQGDAGTSAKSTESILQRLSEMKMKMANIVNSNKNPN